MCIYIFIRKKNFNISVPRCAIQVIACNLETSQHGVIQKFNQSCSLLGSFVSIILVKKHAQFSPTPLPVREFQSYKAE